MRGLGRGVAEVVKPAKTSYSKIFRPDTVIYDRTSLFTFQTFLFCLVKYFIRQRCIKVKNMPCFYIWIYDVSSIPSTCHHHYPFRNHGNGLARHKYNRIRQQKFYGKQHKHILFLLARIQRLMDNHPKPVAHFTRMDVVVCMPLLQ